MSVKVSSWVWHDEATAEINGNEMILLLALADVAADDGRCIYLSDDEDLTYAGLAKKARVDRRTVIRLVAKLRERGLLVQAKGRKGQPNDFTIAVPWRKGDKLSPQDAVTIEADSVTDEAGFGDNGGEHSSYRRTDVRDVDVAPRKRGARIPEPFMLTAEMKAWAAAEVPGLDIAAHTREFVDHWRAASGASASKRDWIAAWRNWMRKAHRWNTPRTSKPTPDARVLDGIDRGRRLAALADAQQGELTA